MEKLEKGDIVRLRQSGKTILTIRKLLGLPLRFEKVKIEDL